MVNDTNIAVIMMALRLMVCGRKGHKAGSLQDSSNLVPNRKEVKELVIRQ